MPGQGTREGEGEKLRLPVCEPLGEPLPVCVGVPLRVGDCVPVCEGVLVGVAALEREPVGEEVLLAVCEGEAVCVAVRLAVALLVGVPVVLAVLEALAVAAVVAEAEAVGVREGEAAQGSQASRCAAVVPAGALPAMRALESADWLWLPSPQQEGEEVLSRGSAQVTQVPAEMALQRPDKKPEEPPNCPWKLAPQHRIAFGGLEVALLSKQEWLPPAETASTPMEAAAAGTSLWRASFAPQHTAAPPRVTPQAWRWPTEMATRLVVGGVRVMAAGAAGPPHRTGVGAHDQHTALPHTSAASAGCPLPLPPCSAQAAYQPRETAMNPLPAGADCAAAP